MLNPIDVECPSCEALPGQLCRVFGREMLCVHTTRFDVEPEPHGRLCFCVRCLGGAPRCSRCGEEIAALAGLCSQCIAETRR